MAAATIDCQSCGAANSRTSKFCDTCGAPLVAALPAKEGRAVMRREAMATPLPPVLSPSAQAPEAETPRRSRRALVVGLTIAAALVLLSAGGIAVGFALSGAAKSQSAEPAQPVVVGPTASSTGEPTGTPTSTSVAAPPIVVAEPQPNAVRQFKSPSGNIRCSIGELDGETSVACLQVKFNYPFPSQACTTGPPGVVVAVNETSTYWPCLSASIEPSEVLPLDVPLFQDGMHCSINYVTGVTCYNANGSGFTMEYDGGVQLF